MILPILVIWDVSAKAPSHIWEVTKKRSLFENKSMDLFKGYAELELGKFTSIGTPILSSLFFMNNILGVNTLDGNSLYSVMLKNIPVIIASGILLLLSLVSSDILMFISININKNNIETAPTYTSK